MFTNYLKQRGPRLKKLLWLFGNRLIQLVIDFFDFFKQEAKKPIIVVDLSFAPMNLK
jgi:hypothetical protein